MQIGCVIMASGASARFGRNKLLANLDGRPLIAHTLANLPRESVAKVVVVSPYEEVARLGEQAGFVSLPPAGPERSDTVRAGVLQMADMDGCLFCVGDQPLCQKASMQRMIDAFREYPESIVRLYSGVIPGNPVLFPKSTFGELGNLPPGKGGSWLVKKYPERVVSVQAAHPWELDDADTPESLAMMEKRLRENQC